MSPSPGEQRLSDDDLPPAPSVRRKKKKKSTAEPPKPAPPAWRRYVMWGVLACLAIGCVVELRAQYFYKHNLRIAQEALDRTEAKKVTYDEIKDRFWSTPESRTGRSDFVENVVYTWSWHGLRKYVVRLYVSPKDGTLRKVESEP